ncbi:efflux RND transporter periplasmic adaptor subunit [Pseudovibrio sp. JE062]|uniref:efflux RND transporter periplasmic adaptor subunit n=1 Tax=Pseudovibrio sp. JE062 TaxID=439495 RepID=UPI0002D3CA13|nr:efflux RND transporter periplasmic adaptor subunit [Pseudovibrio sp. JE062]
MSTLGKILVLLATLALVGCQENTTDPIEPKARPLKTYLVKERPVYSLRSFPSVLEPAELNALSFEIGGTLKPLDLTIGQPISSGEILAQIDPTSLKIELSEAQARLNLANAEHSNAVRALERARTLFSRGAASKVAIENAETTEITSKARLDQATQAVASAQNNLTKATLHAPFDGVINSVEAVSHATVSVGSPIATLYEKDAFELRISAGYQLSSQLHIGTTAEVTLTDQPDVSLTAIVTELGQRADAVSSFPVRLSLVEDSDVDIRAGMAAQVEFKIPLDKPEGYLIPFSAISTDASKVENGEEQIIVFVYDEKYNCVLERIVETSGVLGEFIVVTDGLQTGERIASAGVAFLRDGQKVRLLDVGAE